MSAPLTSTQRKHLRGLAHGLKPVVHVGRQGAAQRVLAMIDRALDDHRLIKIRFVDGGRGKKAVCEEISAALACQLVGVVGHVAILYRPARDGESAELSVG